jgi:hypothetical protein
MQRSITHQNALGSFILFILFLLYESISSIYLFLPPLFTILFLLYANAIKSENLFSLFLILVLILAYEANKGYMALSVVIYFTLMHLLIMPKLEQNISCSICLKLFYVLFTYLGFYLFLFFLSTIFLIDVTPFSYYIIYYIVVEFILVSFL